MNKKLGLILPSLIVPFILVACQTNKEIKSIKVTPKQKIYQVGEVLNKEDFDVKIIYSDDTEKELKTNEWSSKTKFPYRLNNVDRNNGYANVDVRYGSSDTSYTIYVTPFFEFDTISIGYDDTTNFSVPLLNDEYSLIDKVTYKIYDKSVIDFNTEGKNDIKVKDGLTEAQKDSYLWAYLNVDGEEILIDGCTIEAKNFANNITIDEDGNVSITASADAPNAYIPTIKNNHVANKITTVTNPANLKTVILPASLTEIGESAFKNCAALTNVDTSLDTYLIKIGDNAFESCGFDSFSLPKYLKEIGNSCFKNCSNLKTINIASNNQLTFVATNAFEGCTNVLKKDEETNNDEYVKFYADGSLNNYFILNSLSDSTSCKVNEHCKIINADCDVFDSEKFVLPEGIEVIGRNALSTINLDSFTIPSTVEVIGKGAFSSVQSTTKIVLNDYENWYYLKDGKYELIASDVMSNTESLVKQLSETDIYYIEP